MLSPAHATQELWTCLRCQLRLRNHIAVCTTPNALLRPVPSRGFQNGPTRWQEHNSPNTERRDGLHSNEIQAYSPRTEPDRVVFKPRKAGRSWRRVRLGEETVALNMKVLGQPAQIRILPDRTLLLSQSMQPKYEAINDGVITGPEDFLRGMAAEAKAIDPAVVNQNIEDLRTSILGSSNMGDSPTLLQCRDLAQKLHDGFTKPQLEAYLKQHGTYESAIGTTNYDDLEVRFHSRLCTRSAWFSGTSAFPEDAIPRLDPGIAVKKQQDFILGLEPAEGKEAQTEKQRLVERVLRSVWRLRCREETALAGEVDLRLQPEHLKLLLNHRSAMFKKLSEQYGAKIDVSQSQQVVRLTGDYTTCSDLSKLIYFVLEKIQVAEIQVQSVQHKGLIYKLPPSAILNNRSTIEHVEKLTNTVIKLTRSTQGNHVTKLQVYYIGPDLGDFEDVRRLVFQLLEPKTVGKSQVQVEPSKNLIIPIQVPIEVGSVVPWTERGTSWTRWTDGGKSTSFKKFDKILKGVDRSTTLYDPLSSREAAEAAAQFLLGNRDHIQVSNESNDTGYGQFRQTHTISATLGHIVYPALSRQAQAIRAQTRTYRSKDAQDKAIFKHFLESVDSRRTVVTSLPEISKTLERLAPSNFELEHELRIRLSPSEMGIGNDVDTTPMPHIEFRIGLNNQDQNTELRGVQFISDIRESDLLLPREVADIRFRACTLTEAIDNMDPIHQFVADSNFDVWGGKRLRTPPRIKLRVPKALLHADKPDEVEMEYLFVSMEHRSRMEMVYQGISMEYSTIEAGKTGGRRTELQFSEPFSTPKYSVAMFIPFFDTVYEFVALMGRRVNESEEGKIL